MFSEQDVDRELKTALSVKPSPDFEARVRQRVAEDRRVRVGMFPVALKTPGLLAAASVVLLAGLFYVMHQPTAVIDEPATPPVIARTEPRSAPVWVPVTPPATKRVEPPHIAQVRRAAPPTHVAEPEVIVPVNQMEAVRRLVRAVNEGRIAAPTEPVEAPVVLLKEVAIAPLIVEPIPVPALEPDADAPSPIIRGH